MTCRYCPIVEKCKHRKEEKEESLFKRFLDYVFRSDTYYNCEHLREYRLLEPAREVLRKLGVEPDW
jgi:hypothetical protein